MSLIGGISMKNTAYQVSVQCIHDAYCKMVIRNAAYAAIRKLKRKWEKESSLEDLMFEKNAWLTADFKEKDRPKKEFDFMVRGLSIELENEALAVALLQLAETDREMILQYYFLHYSQAEIAQHCGLSRSAIGRHLQSALKQLKMELKKDHQ